MTTRYLLHQRFDYRYPGPIEDLRHRLMVVPPAHHGDQQRLAHRLEVRGGAIRVVERLDGFGNHRYEVRSDRVEDGIEFESWATVERTGAGGSARLPASDLADRRLRRPSRLTRPDAALAAAARDLGESGDSSPLARAERITAWVHRALRYGHGSTSVHTTAAEALAAGSGVCQDYAHVMLAIARRSGLAARYVSGHLVGEGGSHAWVEVLIPDDAQSGSALAIPFDPTNDRRADDQYLTVAVGRDYADVAPTSGTFRAGCAGHLSCRKRLEVRVTASPRDLAPATV